MKKSSYMGMDLGDRTHEVCGLDEAGEVVGRAKVSNTAAALTKFFGALRPGVCVAMEAGTHSGWISRLLESLGLRVVVAQPRKLRALWGRDRKNDASDAYLLAKIVRADASLLGPIRHRSEKTQLDVLSLRSRDALVQSRTKLVNTVRGLAKSLGHQLPKADARYLAQKARGVLAEALRPALEPLLDVLDAINEQIKLLDEAIAQMARQRYPQTQRLTQVTGVGDLTALAFVLTLGEAERFECSREVGPYLGLVPRQKQSGQMDQQLRITKAGDGYVRRLLVGSAQYILGAFGPPCGLRSFGQRLAARGAKNGKRRAVVAVARKLAVLLHKLWVSGQTYDPLRGLTAPPVGEVSVQPA